MGKAKACFSVPLFVNIAQILQYDADRVSVPLTITITSDTLAGSWDKRGLCLPGVVGATPLRHPGYAKCTPIGVPPPPVALSYRTSRTSRTSRIAQQTPGIRQGSPPACRTVISDESDSAGDTRDPPRRSAPPDDTAEDPGRGPLCPARCSRHEVPKTPGFLRLTFMIRPR